LQNPFPERRRATIGTSAALCTQIPTQAAACRHRIRTFDPRRRRHMTKNIILWMLGVPISVLILLNIFGII
jgi:predicted nucleic acid-binding Zn ribbon protein